MNTIICDSCGEKAAPRYYFEWHSPKDFWGHMDVVIDNDNDVHLCLRCLVNCLLDVTVQEEKNKKEKEIQSYGASS